MWDPEKAAAELLAADPLPPTKEKRKKRKKRGPKPLARAHTHCLSCSAEFRQNEHLRAGPKGPRTLCNPCGQKWQRKRRERRAQLRQQAGGAEQQEEGEEREEREEQPTRLEWALRRLDVQRVELNHMQEEMRRLDSEMKELRKLCGKDDNNMSRLNRPWNTIPERTIGVRPKRVPDLEGYFSDE